MDGNPLVAFLSDLPMRQLIGLKSRFRKSMAATGETVVKEGRAAEETLAEMIDLLSPYSAGGLATFLDLSSQSSYFRLYRFLSEELVRGGRARS